jgi:hypothetical protein
VWDGPFERDNADVARILYEGRDLGEDFLISRSRNYVYLADFPEGLVPGMVVELVFAEGRSGGLILLDKQGEPFIRLERSSP